MITQIDIDDLPVRHDETIHHGATWPLVIVWSEMDLSGCSARLVVRDASRNVLLSKSSAEGTVSIGVDFTSGTPVSTLRVEASPSETGAIASTVTRGVFELRIDDPAGTSYPLIKGAVAIDRGAVS